jgi:hypothetical protein
MELPQRMAFQEAERKKFMTGGQVLAWIIDLYQSRGAKVKKYLTEKEVDELNEENKRKAEEKRKADEAKNGGGGDEKKKKPLKYRVEEYPPQLGAKWWSHEVPLHDNRWSEENLYELVTTYLPEIYDGGAIWFKEETLPPPEGHVVRLLGRAGEPLSLKELEERVHKRFAFVNEQGLRNLAKLYKDMHERVLDLEKIVFTEQDRVALGLYTAAECLDGTAAAEGEAERTVDERIHRYVKLYEGRLQALEEKLRQKDETMDKLNALLALLSGAGDEKLKKTADDAKKKAQEAKVRDEKNAELHRAELQRNPEALRKAKRRQRYRENLKKRLENEKKKEGAV